MPAKQKNNENEELENPKAFKHWISEPLVTRIANSIAAQYPDFSRANFLRCAFFLRPLELKDRVRHVREALHDHLPKSYPKALKVILSSARSGDLQGFDLWPYSDFIQTYGMEHLDRSLSALRDLTPLFTSEFAVRPFILKHPQPTMSFLLGCARSEDLHVRRWASEGTRPRLPWGEKLRPFITDPAPSFSILEKLKFDEELYVRKSVSNHLNDIAKDHPEAVLKILGRWSKLAGKKHAKKIEWIIRRSLRSLIKNGNPQALKLIGADPKAKIRVHGLKLRKQTFTMNEKIEFAFRIESDSKKSQKVVIDYVVHYVKFNHETTPKVFKLKTFTLEPGQVVGLVKKHPLKPITTRRYYGGKHRLEIQVNGRVYASAQWNLEL